VAFIGAGGTKLVGVPAMVEMFGKVGLGQWFRYVTGVLEVAGAPAPRVIKVFRDARLLTFAFD